MCWSQDEWKWRDKHRVFHLMGLFVKWPIKKPLIPLLELFMMQPLALFFMSVITFEGQKWLDSCVCVYVCARGHSAQAHGTGRFMCRCSLFPCQRHVT